MGVDGGHERVHAHEVAYLALPEGELGAGWCSRALPDARAAMVAEFESDLIRLRTVEGMKVTRAKGRLRGKQPKLNRKQEAHLVSLVHSGEYSTAEVAELFGVGRSTMYRAIERQRVAAKAGLAEASSSR